jgi:ABC-type nitrate/sulfonate/bicarbonate transport system substrate-binding protein
VLSACGGTAAPPTPSPAGSTQAAASVAPLSPPVTVRVGDSQQATQAGLYLGIANGYFQQEGVNIELVPSASLETQMAIVARGDLDVISGAAVPALFNAIERGVGMQISAASGIQAPGRSQLIVARKELVDSGHLNDYADLRGRNIVRPATLGLATLALERALARGNVQPSEVNFVNLGQPETIVALSNEAVDVGYLAEPYATTAIEKGVAAKWRELGDFVPNHASFWIYSGQFIETNPEAARRFMVGLLRGARDYELAFTKAQGRTEVVQALTKYTTIKDPAMYDKMTPIKISADGVVDTAALQEDVEWLQSKGALQTLPDVNKIVNQEFTRYALQRLGPSTTP